MSAKFFTGSISVSKLLEEAKKPHSAFYTGKDDKKYLNVKIWVNEEPNQFGDHISIQFNGKKDAENYKVYLGNAKAVEQKEPAQFTEKDSQEIPADDDLPF